jgi:hypothetical protein
VNRLFVPLLVLTLAVDVSGCNTGRAIVPPAGSTAEKFLGTWSGVISNKGLGQSLITGDEYTVEFSYTAPKGQPDSSAGLWATITHRSATTAVGGTILDSAHASDKDVTYTQNLTIDGLEASGLRSLLGKTYGTPVRFRLDNADPNVLHYTIDDSTFGVELKRVVK